MNKLIRNILSVALFAATFIFAHPARGADADGCRMREAGKLGPITRDLFHVQGIAFSTGSIYITSVDKEAAAAWLWKLDRRTLDVTASRKISDNFMYHPSGLQFDGKYLRVAIAVYLEKSNSKVLTVDPATLKTVSKFAVADHIGAVAADGSGMLYGMNWNARKIYMWKEDGKPDGVRDNPNAHGYQDCKARVGTLVCAGGGSVDFIDIKTWKPLLSIAAPALPNGNNATREGMEFDGKTLYFLPDDGAGAYIYEYELEGDCGLPVETGKPALDNRP